jgi:hypothetical protein
MENLPGSHGENTIGIVKSPEPHRDDVADHERT